MSDEYIAGPTPEELLREVFDMVAMSHFRDHKLSPFYLEQFRLRRRLGERIAEAVANRFPDHYARMREQCEEAP